MSKEFFEALLETFAREAEAGLSRIILLVLDNAGWHGPANLKIPDGVRLIYLPPYSPELQPAETLWALVDEPIVNQHIATITDLDEKIAAQCIALSEQREQIQSRTGFHWWPKRIATGNGMTDHRRDGSSLDDKRAPIEANDILDMLTKWPAREEGANSYRVP